MRDDTRRLVRTLVGALAAGMVTFLGALQTAINSGGALTTIAWVSAAAAGGVAMFSTIQAFLSNGPGNMPASAPPAGTAPKPEQGV